MLSSVPRPELADPDFDFAPSSGHGDFARSTRRSEVPKGSEGEEGGEIVPMGVEKNGGKTSNKF